MLHVHDFSISLETGYLLQQTYTLLDVLIGRLKSRLSKTKFLECVSDPRRI